MYENSPLEIQQKIIKHRPVVVDGQLYQVPTGIYRVTPTNPSHSPFWQVRFSRKSEPRYSMCFPDPDGKDSVKQSLEAAIKHFESIQENYISNDNDVSYRRAHKPVVSWTLRKGRTTWRCALGLRLTTLRGSDGKNRYKQFWRYLGAADKAAKKRITQKRIDEANLLCYAAWFWATKMIDEKGRAAVMSEEIPEDKILMTYLPKDFDPPKITLEDVLAKLDKRLGVKAT